MQLLIGHSRSVWLWGATVRVVRSMYGGGDQYNCTDYMLLFDEWITTKTSMWDQLHQLNGNKHALVILCSLSALYH